jgi:hypothetical protein
MMAEKPILFNAEMVNAILDGRKTQTRRLVKVSHRGAAGFNVCFRKSTGEFTGVYDWNDEESMYEDKTPAPCQPGDILWVRETWCQLPISPGGHTRIPGRYYYKADPEMRPEGWRGNWKPSIHMPKEAARLYLKVKDVRIERLQEISEDDALAEGADAGEYLDEHGNLMDVYYPHEDFVRIWNSTVKKADLPCYGWDANPWVWVIEFERINPQNQ